MAARDFSEVAMSRTAHRDGHNEYLINSQQVRLREMNELLAQAGLSERTYHHPWTRFGGCFSGVES